MQKNKRAVVTGGAGFIGSNLVDALLGAGWSVDVIDDLSAGKKENVDKRATLHVADIRDYNAIAPIMAGADCVFHLAALPRVQYSIEFPLETHDVNVNGMQTVFLAARDGKARRVVYAASSSAYGNQETMPLREDMLARPLSPYGLHKYVGEKYASVFYESYGLPTVSLRYFNVYGPRLNPEGAYALVIGRFLKLLSEGKPLTITGDGEQTRDFTHVSDVVRANLLAAESENVGGGEVLNIGAGREISINELARIMGGKVEYIAKRAEPRRTLASTERAKRLLGWEPSVTIEEGVASLLKEWNLR